MAAKRRLTPWMWGVGGVTFLAGLLFGYDQGVISGALPLLQADLSALCVMTYVFVWFLVPETKGARSRRSRSGGS